MPPRKTVKRKTQPNADTSTTNKTVRFTSQNSFEVLNDDPPSPAIPTPVNNALLVPAPVPTGPRKRTCAKHHTQQPSINLPRRPARHGHATRNKTRYHAARHQSAQPAINHTVLDSTSNPHCDHLVNSVIDPNSSESLEYRHLIKDPDAKHYLQANINEICWLTDGHVGGPEITGTNTGKFIHLSQLPPGRTATYLQPIIT